MTPKERACELQEAIGADPGDLPLIIDAIRAAEETARAEAMEWVARRLTEDIILKLDYPNMTLIGRTHNSFRLQRYQDLSWRDAEFYPSFAAALAALTPEERAAWERDA